MATRVIVIDFDRRLIQLVERNPILWDTRTDSYKLSEKKPSVWADIADEIETSPGTAKQRWNDMRTQYRKYLIKVQKWKQLVASDSGLNKSLPPRKYKYAEDLQFLNDVLNFEPTEETHIDHGGDVSSAYFMFEADLDPDSISSVDDTKVGLKRRKSDLDYCDMLKGAVKSIDKLTSSVNTASKDDISEVQDDDDWLFARRIYLKLKAIPNNRDKELFKLKVDTDLLTMMYGGLVPPLGAHIVIPDGYSLPSEYTAPS